MSLSLPTGPLGHAGIAWVISYLLRLNPVVTVFCGILPDLVDKPLSAAGIGGGRYIGHTLLFLAVISGAFFLWKRAYGIAALIGGMSHLLLDLNALVPWFYPFKDYSFSKERLDFVEWAKRYFTFSDIGMEFIIVAVVGLAVFTLMPVEQYCR